MFNTVAKAKLTFNKKLKLYKLVVAFNVNKKLNKQNELVWDFPVQKKCDYVSGDIAITEVPDTIAFAERMLRTNNIMLVGE